MLVVIEYGLKAAGMHSIYIYKMNMDRYTHGEQIKEKNILLDQIMITNQQGRRRRAPSITAKRLLRQIYFLFSYDFMRIFM